MKKIILLLLVFFINDRASASCTSTNLLNRVSVTARNISFYFDPGFRKYQIELSLDGYSYPIRKENTINEINVPDLDPGNRYFFRYRKICPDKSWSSWSSSFTNGNNQVINSIMTICDAPRANSELIVLTEPRAPGTISTDKISMRVFCDLDARQYQFRIRETSITNWVLSPETTAETYVFFNVINPTKAYDVQCRIQCTDHTWTDWSGSKPYPNGICETPNKDQLHASRIRTQSARLQCNANHSNGTVQSHSFRWKLDDTTVTSWTTQTNVSNNYLHIEYYPNINSNKYVFQVRHDCIWDDSSPNDKSEWSESKKFSTINDCTVSLADFILNRQSIPVNYAIGSSLRISNEYRWKITRLYQVKVSASRPPIKIIIDSMEVSTHDTPTVQIYSPNNLPFYSDESIRVHDTGFNVIMQHSVLCKGEFTPWSDTKTFPDYIEIYDYPHFLTGQEEACFEPLYNQLIPFNIDSNSVELHCLVNADSFQFRYRDTTQFFWRTLPYQSSNFLPLQ